MSQLFESGAFRLHSGSQSSFRIDADALTDKDLSSLALQVARRFRWNRTISVPRGGDRFAAALRPFGVPCVELPNLIVDDVFTTGASMEQHRWRDMTASPIGVVIFARNPTPDWIHSIFRLWA